MGRWTVGGHAICGLTLGKASVHLKVDPASKRLKGHAVNGFCTAWLLAWCQEEKRWGNIQYVPLIGHNTTCASQE